MGISPSQYRYCGNNSIRWTDATGLATKAECEAVKNEVMKGPWYAALTKQGCKPKEIQCIEKPDGKDGTTGAEGGLYDPDNNIVYVFFGNQSKDTIERVMIHELIHAFNKCKGLGAVKINAIGRSACDELRAYYFSGQCNVSVNAGGRLRRGESSSDCLLRQAMASIEHEFVGKKAALFDSEDFVCCVWSSCLCGSNLPGGGRYFFSPSLGTNAFPSVPKKCTESPRLCEQMLGKGGAQNLSDWTKPNK